MESVKRKGWLPDSQFRAMKAKLGQQRVEAVTNFCDGSFVDAADTVTSWCLTRGDPGVPPPALIEWDAQRGGSRVVSGGCCYHASAKAETSTSARHNCRAASGFPGQLVFEGGDMISFAASVAQAGRRVCVLNMANRSTPGGGFLSACRAQEEQLCHRSNLFPRLKLHRKFGGYPIDVGSALLTPEVDLLLEDGKTGFVPLTQGHVRVSVVSAAADDYHNEDAARRDRKLEMRADANWRAVLLAAGQSGAQVAVLSALGCGAFCNPPDVIAASLARVLREPLDFGALETVAIVIMEDHNSNDNLGRFREALEVAAAKDGLHQPSRMRHGDAAASLLSVPRPRTPPLHTLALPSGYTNLPHVV